MKSQRVGTGKQRRSCSASLSRISRENALQTFSIPFSKKTLFGLFSLSLSSFTRKSQVSTWICGHLRTHTHTYTYVQTYSGRNSRSPLNSECWKRNGIPAGLCEYISFFLMFARKVSAQGYDYHDRYVPSVKFLLLSVLMAILCHHQEMISPTLICETLR